MEKDKFKTLESIKETNAKQSIPVIISVGIAVVTEDNLLWS